MPPHAPNGSSIRHHVALAEQEGLSRLEAQRLMLRALARDDADRAWLIAHDTDPMPPQALGRWLDLLAAWRAGQPMAYLLGQQEFYGLPLRVDARVLVPRPDTETLVDWALELLAAEGKRGPVRRVIDLGTGSGAIALALACSAADLEVTAVDRSDDALQVARDNALLLERQGHRAAGAVRFRAGGWWSAVPGERFGLAVSNPPYIADDDPHLLQLHAEPRAALVAQEHGLSDLRQIIAAAPGHLEPGAWLLLEHGYQQARAVCAMLVQCGFESVQTRHDLAGIERCSGGRWPAVE